MKRRDLLRGAAAAVGALALAPLLPAAPAPAAPAALFDPQAAVGEKTDAYQVSKFGMKIELDPTLFEDPQYELIEAYARAAGQALRRRQEEIIFGART